MSDSENIKPSADLTGPAEKPDVEAMQKRISKLEEQVQSIQLILESMRTQASGLIPTAPHIQKGAPDDEESRRRILCILANTGKQPAIEPNDSTLRLLQEMMKTSASTRGMHERLNLAVVTMLLERLNSNTPITLEQLSALTGYTIITLNGRVIRISQCFAGTRFTFGGNRETGWTVTDKSSTES